MKTPFKTRRYEIALVVSLAILTATMVGSLVHAALTLQIVA